ncbi:MAG: PASTA domain-containing protein [Desulfobacterales bacterium]
MTGQPVVLRGRPETPAVDAGGASYRWRLIGRPDRSSADIADPVAEEVTLQADTPGVYTVEFRMQAEGEESLPQYVVIRAEDPVLEMPDVTGLPIEKARALLESSGIAVEVLSILPDPQIPEGRVVAQEPAAGVPLEGKPTAQLAVALSPQADTDGDGLADAWEYRMFGHLKEGGDQDSDGDGFTNIQEYRIGTHPADRGEAPVEAINLFEYDRFGRIVFKQVALEP